MRSQMTGTAMRDIELQEWEIAGHILDDMGERAGDFVFRAARDPSNNNEAMRRWFSIMAKMQELNGRDGAVH
jgi:hypothetical protein